MGLTRRPATGADREFLWKLHEAAMRPHVEAVWGWDPGDQRKRFDAAFNPANVEILGESNVAVGMIEVARGASEWFLARMALLPNVQGRGHGGAILRELCAKADAEGATLRLQVLKNNPAYRLYSRTGFEDTGETETHRMMVRRPLREMEDHNADTRG